MTLLSNISNYKNHGNDCFIRLELKEIISQSNS